MALVSSFHEFTTRVEVGLSLAALAAVVLISAWGFITKGRGW